MSKVRALVVPADPDIPMSVVWLDPTLANITGEIHSDWIENVGAVAMDGTQWHAYVDEEGKLNGKPVNARANILVTELGWQSMPGDFLVGDAIFFGESGSGDEGDVPDEVVRTAVSLQPVVGR